MLFVTGTPAELQQQQMTDLARYRHKVFVGMLGWSLQCENGLEYDEFDRSDTVYVVARDEEGEIMGTARLLPTTRPYLLSEVFPQLWGAEELPRTDEIWELSRFAAVDFNSASSAPLSQFSSQIAIDLLKVSIEEAVKRGASKIVTVSPVGVERLLRMAGFAAHRVGIPIIMDKHPITALMISTEQSHHRQFARS